jgi:hypothetical protein
VSHDPKMGTGYFFDARALDSTDDAVRRKSSLSPFLLLHGVATVFIVLAVVAIIPVLNFAALGYLLAVQGGLARGQRLVDALPGLRFAPGFARAVVLSWLWLVPLRVLSGFAEDAVWIAPQARAAAVLEVLRVGGAVFVGLHLASALLRGGTFGAFVRPWKSLAWLVRFAVGKEGPAPVAQAVSAALAEIRPLALALNGAKAGVVALVWLALPVGLMWLSRVGPARPGVGLLGALLLVPVLALLPFSQARFAATGYLSALFDWRAARAVWRRAPLSALLSHLLLAALTTPLYLLTVVIAPRDALWPAALVFIAALFPARAAVALALRRSDRQRSDAPRWLRFGVAPLALVLMLAWAGLLLLTPAIDHRGAMGLWSPPAFVLPAPF